MKKINRKRIILSFFLLFFLLFFLFGFFKSKVVISKHTEELLSRIQYVIKNDNIDGLKLEYKRLEMDPSFILLIVDKLNTDQRYSFGKQVNKYQYGPFYHYYKNWKVRRGRGFFGDKKEEYISGKCIIYEQELIKYKVLLFVKEID